jgi:hypothetical protein
MMLKKWEDLPPEMQTDEVRPYYDMLKKGLIKNMLLVGTGAMMSPQSLLQGLSIPAVAHLVEFEVRT